MASWQSHILTTVFRLRRRFNPPARVLDVEKERAETEALAANFKTDKALVRTPVVIDGMAAEWISAPGAATEGVILYFHGGSYHSGSINSHRSLVANIARSANTRALLIEYRLAPENPFPAAVEDAVTAYRWLLGNKLRPEHLILAGDSSGGGLALSLLLKLRETHEPLPGAAVCLSPWTDLTGTGESWETNAEKDIILDAGSLLKSAQLYLGEADPQIPLASPLYADLRGLPPLLIQVGSDEILLSDSTCLAERAQEAGVEVTLEVWAEMQHEWHFAANILPEGRKAIHRIGQFVRSHIA